MKKEIAVQLALFGLALVLLLTAVMCARNAEFATVPDPNLSILLEREAGSGEGEGAQDAAGPADAPLSPGRSREGTGPVETRY